MNPVARLSDKLRWYRQGRAARQAGDPFFSHPLEPLPRLWWTFGYVADARWCRDYLTEPTCETPHDTCTASSSPSGRERG